MARLEWEKVEHNLNDRVFRAKVPGGWIVWVYDTDAEGIGGLTVVPDPNREALVAQGSGL